MEKLILIIVATLCSIQMFSISLENEHLFACHVKPLGGVITMEDMILSVSLDDPSDTIESIKVYDSVGNPVQIESGCHQKNCNYPIQKLQPGTYEVLVNVYSGLDFSGYITVQ